MVSGNRRAILYHLAGTVDCRAEMGKNRSHLPMITFGLALVSALWMAILYSPDTDPSRVYYGTDTRAFALLIGCSLAFVWPMQRLSSKRLLPVGRRILHIAGFGSFAIFLFCVYAVDDFDAFLYQGGMLLFCLNAAILIGCVCHPASLIGKWLSFQPLVWLGKRSYGIYLWHYPIIVLTTPVIEIGQPSIARVTLQLIAILLVAEASYRFIEQPIRQHGFRQYFSSWSIWKKESNSGLHLIRCSLGSPQLFDLIYHWHV